MKSESFLALLCAGAGLLSACGNSLPAASGINKQAAGACDLPGALASEGVCVQWFDPGPGRDREASLASHPSDPNTILLTWREDTPDSPARQIFAALTTDGGRNWRRRLMRNTEVLHLGLPDEKRDSFDSTVAFSPDGGSAYVLFGGENFFSDFGYDPEYRMTLARSDDAGATWVYSQVEQIPREGLPIKADYMDLAVAPDTGDIYVVAVVAGYQYFADEALFFWRSTDKGASWTVQPLPVGLDGGAAFRYLPRVEAGPGGLVVVTAEGVIDNGSLVAIVSRDGGKSFDPPTAIHTLPQGGLLKNDPTAIAFRQMSDEVALVFGNGTQVLGTRSRDTARTWPAPVTLATFPAGMRQAWMSVDYGEGGDVYAQYRYAGGDPLRFGVGALRWTRDGEVFTRSLIDIPDIPGRFDNLDDYGAITVAADGAVWMAWSDPRGGGPERIALTRVLPENFR